MIPIIWLAIAMIGLALAILSLVEAATDFMSTRPTNGFRALAIGDMISESLRVVLYLVFGGIGVYYIVADIQVARSGVASFMVLGELIIVAKTVVQLAVRRYLKKTHPGGLS